MNVAYLKVMCGLCFNLFPLFSRRQTADVRHRGGIVVRQLWSPKDQIIIIIFFIIYKIIKKFNMWPWTTKAVISAQVYL